MIRNWAKDTEQDKREDLVYFIYKQNDKILKDRDALVSETMVQLINQKLIERRLSEISENIAALYDERYTCEEALEQVNKNLVDLGDEFTKMDEDIQRYYQELIDAQ